MKIRYSCENRDEATAVFSERNHFFLLFFLITSFIFAREEASLLLLDGCVEADYNGGCKKAKQFWLGGNKHERMNCLRIYQLGCFCSVILCALPQGPRRQEVQRSKERSRSHGKMKKRKKSWTSVLLCVFVFSGFFFHLREAATCCRSVFGFLAGPPGNIAHEHLFYLRCFVAYAFFIAHFFGLCL